MNASMNGFRRKTFHLWKNGAIKYITHLEKLSYFPKLYNFREIMLFSQYPSENLLVELYVLSNNLETTIKYSQKLSIIGMTRSVSCFVCIEIIVFTLFA